MLYFGTTYEFKVGSGCPILGLSWSVIQTFTTRCPLPYNLQVTNIGSTSATLKWNEGLTRYNWDGTTVNNMLAYRITPSGAWYTLTVNGADTLLLTGLSPQTNYLFQVLTLCKHNVYNSFWSAPKSFTTLPSGNTKWGISQGIDNLSAEINVYPNPVSSSTILSIPALDETIVVFIVDAYGRKLRIIETNSPETLINTSDLTSGLYTITFVLNGNVVNIRLQVIK
jgi:hypothetical protein